MQTSKETGGRDLERDWPRWRRYIRACLKEFRSHDEYEDLVGEGALALVQIDRRYPDAPLDRFAAILRPAVRFAALSYLRSPGYWGRKTTKGGVERESLLLAEALLSESGAGDTLPLSLRSGDFVEALLDRLELEDRMTAAGIDSTGRKLLYRYYAEGWTDREISQWQGITPTAVYHRRMALLARLHGVSARAWRVSSKPGGPYRGVVADGRRYEARVSLSGATRHLGSFATAEEAALVHDAAVVAFGLAKAPLNLLPESYRKEKP